MSQFEQEVGPFSQVLSHIVHKYLGGRCFWYHLRL